MNNIKLMIDGINCSSVIINPNAIDQYYDNSNSKNIISNNIQNVIEEIDNHISNINIDIENNKEYIDNRISILIGTVPETLDTLEEISTAITNNSDTITILNEAIGNKANKIHSHTISDITNFPSSMPASDVYSWAKASTKPKYTYNEVGADASGSAATALTNANAYTNTKINEKFSEIFIQRDWAMRNISVASSTTSVRDGLLALSTGFLYDIGYSCSGTLCFRINGGDIFGNYFYWRDAQLLRVMLCTGYYVIVASMMNGKIEHFESIGSLAQ